MSSLFFEAPRGAALHKKRAASVDETNKGGRFNEGLLKTVTGGAKTMRVGLAASKGDAVARSIVAACGKKLGLTLAILVDVINPDRIVIGGLAMRLGDTLLEPARKALRQEALESALTVCSVVPATLGESIGDVAALCIAMDAGDQLEAGAARGKGTGMSAISKPLQGAIAVLPALEELEPTPLRAVAMCAACLKSGGKLLVCGNGGSAAEAMHLVGELVGRYKSDRAPLAAIALGTDPALGTCIGNDYSYDELFSRQLRASGRRGDVLVAFTTSGCSPNILQALKAANEMGIESIAFLGRDGGAALPLATLPLLVRHTDTARIQEGHQFLMHSLMDLLEAEVVPPDAKQ